MTQSSGTPAPHHDASNRQSTAVPLTPPIRPEADAAERFGKLKQDAVNHWSVRDR